MKYTLPTKVQQVSSKPKPSTDKYLQIMSIHFFNVFYFSDTKPQKHQMKIYIYPPLSPQHP